MCCGKNFPLNIKVLRPECFERVNFFFPRKASQMKKASFSEKRLQVLVHGGNSSSSEALEAVRRAGGGCLVSPWRQDRALGVDTGGKFLHSHTALNPRNENISWAKGKDSSEDEEKLQRVGIPTGTLCISLHLLGSSIKCEPSLHSRFFWDSSPLHGKEALEWPHLLSA